MLAAIPRAWLADEVEVTDSPGSLARSVMQMDPSTSRGGMKAACGTQIIMMTTQKFSRASDFGSTALFSDFSFVTWQLIKFDFDCTYSNL